MDISTRLLPQFAYSANPYMASVMARMNADWGFPDPYYPAAPLGIFSYSSDLATQYVSGLPPYIYMPTFFGSLANLTILDPRTTVPNIPYATTSEVIHTSAISLADALIRNIAVAGATLATIGASFSLEPHIGGVLYGLGKRLPLTAPIVLSLESGISAFIGKSGLLTQTAKTLAGVPFVGGIFYRTASWLASLSGSSVLRFLLDFFPGVFIAESIARLLGETIIDPVALAITDTQKIRASLGRLMIGSEEWNPATGTIRTKTAHEIFRSLNDLWADEITLQYGDVISILTAGSQLGLFDPIGPNKDRLIQAIKAIASHLRIISEIARDPSMVDTLKNLSALAQLGVPVEMTPIVYKQLSITSTAYGKPFSQMFPALQQEFGQFYMQLGLSPYTGVVAGNEAFLYSTVANEVLRERGMYLFVSSLGGGSGIARLNTILFGQLIKTDPLTQFMIIGSGFGPLNKLDFAKTIDPRSVFAYQIFDAEIAQKFVEDYGGPQWFNLHRGLLIDRFIAKTVKDPITRAYILSQLGAPPELVRAVATGDFEYYLDTIEKMALRKHQAKLAAALDEMELRSYGIIGTVSMFIRKVETIPRKIASHIVGGIQNTLENLRLETRLGLARNPVSRILGKLLWGMPKVGGGALLGMQSKYFGTNVSLDEETILEILETMDIYPSEVTLSGLERDLIESLATGEYKRIKLFEAPMEKIRNRVSLVARMEEEGFMERVKKLDSPLEVARLLDVEYGDELEKYDEVAKAEILAYALTGWSKSKGLTERELSRYIHKDLSRLKIDDLIAERARTERYLTRKYMQDISRLRRLDDVVEFGGDSILAYGSEAVKKISGIIKSDVERVLKTGEFEGTTFTKEEYRYIQAYIEERAKGRKELSVEAVKGFELLKEKAGIEDHLSRYEAVLLYRFIDQGKLFKSMYSYSLMKEKEELLKRLAKAIPFSFHLQDIHRYSQEFFVKQLLESGAREVYFDLIKTYHSAIEDKKITPEERKALVEKANRLKEFILDIAQQAPEDLKRRLLEITTIQDPVKFSEQLYQGLMIGIKGDIGTQEKVGLVNTLRMLADTSSTLEKNFRLLNDAIGGVLKKLGIQPHGINVAGR